jgi:CO dehydrogenase/acetyl-CoA synthase epsilon subunit
LERKKKAKEALIIMGDAFPDTDERKLELVFKLVRNFKDKYTQGINGKYYYENLDSK